MGLASSCFISYEHSGGKNASLDAIRPGHGGQQNKQHSSLKLKPFIALRFGGISAALRAILVNFSRTQRKRIEETSCVDGYRCGRKIRCSRFVVDVVFLYEQLIEVECY